MAQDTRYYEGDTVRVALANLTHDLVGNIDQNATITYVAYRADEDTLSTGSLTWSPKLNAWQASILAPDPVDTNPETILVVIEATASGAVRHFRTTFDVYEVGP